jgi:AraC family transcriptional regulator
VISEAHSARENHGDEMEFHELALRLGGAVCTALSASPRARRAPTSRDERRVAQAVRRIEACSHEKLTLNDLAADVAASPYHFLRVFEQVVGVTPGQYILRDRLRRAAVRLRSSADRVADIALETGFGDLSTFNRHFRRGFGATPNAFRARGISP